MSFCPVSVILPTYNRENLIEKGLRSVIKQTLLPAEIIVIDDGSDDNTEELVLKTSEQTIIPIRYIYQQNKGPSAARNRGILASRYDILAFLDSDDHWHKKKLQLQYSELIKNEDYLISHTMEKWFLRGKHLNQKKKHLPRHGMIFDHCLQLCAVGMSTVMVRKKLFELVGYFDEKLQCCEDYDLWLRVSCSYPFLLIPERLTIKEGGREDQLSTRYRVGMDELRIKSIYNVLKQQKLSDDYFALAYNELQRKTRIFGEGCIKHGRREIGEYYINLPQEFQKQRS